jgi:lipopolysaccharide export system protein LptA
MRRAILALLLLAPLAAPAQELNLSGNSPIEINARDAIELRQNDQVVIARGAARAVREGVTITADRLIARYRPRSGAAPASAQPGSDPFSGSGANELWRLEAEGTVRIFTATDTATAERAVYDMDQAVLVLTGRNLSLFNATDKVTARDALEYWPQRRMAVARGDATVETPGRRIRADTLVAWFLEASPVPPAGQPAPQTAQRPPGQPDTGRLDKVEAFNNVVIRTEAETVQGDRGVYNARTGIALLGGQVRITRGQNQLNGALAEVNLRTGVSRLLSGPDARVTGLVVPQGGGPDGLPLGPQQQRQQGAQ